MSFITQEVEVQAPVGRVVGYVKQTWSICKPHFKICDASGDTVLEIEGPCCTCSCCGDVEFQVCLSMRYTVCGVSKLCYHVAW